MHTINQDLSHATDRRVLSHAQRQTRFVACIQTGKICLLQQIDEFCRMHADRRVLSHATERQDCFQLESSKFVYIISEILLQRIKSS